MTVQELCATKLGEHQIAGVAVPSNASLLSRCQHNVHSGLRQVLAERSSRRVAMYICLKLAFALVQFGYGTFSRSLGVVSESFHTSFDCVGLSFALLAIVAAAKPPSHPYSYGLDRLEVFSGFTNAIFLCFVACFLAMESIHRLYKPPSLHTNGWELAVAELVVGLVGVGLFHSHRTLPTTSTMPSGPGGSGSWAGSRGHACNMHGVFLHVLADCLDAASSIAATWITRHMHWTACHAVLGLALAAVVVHQAWPLTKFTGIILLQTVPPEARIGIERCIREISFYDGVLECRAAHWWTHSPGVAVGSLHIRVRSDADEQKTLNFARELLGKYVTHLTIQIEKDSPVDWLVKQGH